VDCALGVASFGKNAAARKLIASNVSRLVDCNRPKSARDAMPKRAGTMDVGKYRPNGSATTNEPAVIMIRFTPALVRPLQPFKTRSSSLCSFTPIFHGTPRNVEIGILR
jgi:predicted N-formylglutamate amidohydrolase